MRARPDQISGEARIIGCHGPRLRRCLLSLLALGAVLSGAGGRAAYAEDDYQLGHGIDVGPFNFAGYGNLVGGISDNGTKSASLDDISLFVTGHIGRLFNPFMEA